MKSNVVFSLASLIFRVIKLNFRIVFANRFIWFLVASIGFYILLSAIYIFNENQMRTEDMYGILLFSGILIVFYPSVFGIQNDQDARTIEILFGIPNYRYKVWLVRILMIYLLAFITVAVFSTISSTLIVKFRIMDMTTQVMVPVLLLGTMAFMVSTLIRSGNGTAVVMIIFGILFMILSDPMEQSRWNLFLNPFDAPSGVSDVAWKSIAADNRIIQAVGTVLFLLAALFNLQKREKFM
ncbi:MAG: hypothetical protein R6W67_09415 [Bacteroidales bacterium]